MGIIVICDERPIWEPSLAVGRLFIAEIRALEEMIGLKSGFSDIVSDEVSLDETLLAAFLDVTGRRLAETNNGPLKILSAGCIQIAIALYACAAGEWIALPESLNVIERGAVEALRPEARYIVLSEQPPSSVPPPEGARDWTVVSKVSNRLP